MPPRQIKHTGRVISKQIDIAAPPEAVRKALTDPEELKRWFPLDARGKPGPGGDSVLIPQARVEALHDRWTQVLERLFPASA